MTVRGTLNANALKVAQLNIDYLRNPVHMEILSALVNERTGVTVGWTQADSGILSNKTHALLKELIESIEEDIAARVFVEGAVASPAVQRSKPGLSGLGEHVSGGEDAPSI